MSYKVFFSFSKGLSKSIRVPVGTLKEIHDDIDCTEERLGLKRTPTYTPKGEQQKPGWHWGNCNEDILTMAGPKIDKSLPQWWLADRERESKIQRMGKQVLRHNAFVRLLYSRLDGWAKQKPKGKTEVITVAQSVEFWGGLQILDFPRELWSKDHFRDHMEYLHELLTKGSSRGTSLDCKPFNAKQADALLNIIESELDQWEYDMRFSIPLDAYLKPYDFIACSYDGGYDWCSYCGPINSDDFRERCRVCPRAKRGKCELKNSFPEEFEDRL